MLVRFFVGGYALSKSSSLKRTLGRLPLANDLEHDVAHYYLFKFLNPMVLEPFSQCVLLGLVPSHARALIEPLKPEHRLK